MDYKKITGVILAGGRGRRLGNKEKHSLQIGEQNFLTLAMQVLPFEKKLLSVRDKMSAENFENMACAVDMYDAIGPIGGIYSALLKAETPYIFVIPCDTPLLTRELITFMCERAVEENEITIARQGEREEPLCGLYSRSLIERIKNQIEVEKRYAIMRLVDMSKSAIIDLPPELLAENPLLNVNTPEDLERAKKILMEKQ